MTSRRRSMGCRRSRSMLAGRRRWRRCSSCRPRRTLVSCGSRRSSTLTDARATFAAADLGAESGRIILGHLDDGSLELEEIHRFPNTPVSLPHGVHWNLVGLFDQMRAGLAMAAAAHGPIDGIGIDTWGVDYGLLDGGG